MPDTAVLLRSYSCKGFLFIGDPQVTSVRPGLRKEGDKAFLDVALGKLAAAIEIANRFDLVPVILGDLLDSGDDEKSRLVCRMIRTLKTARHKAVCLIGNHDLTIAGAIHHNLTDDHVLMTLIEADALVPIREVGEIVEVFIEGAGPVVLGGSPHGRDIPEDVTPWTAGRTAVWLTHHDLDFGGSYPNAQERKPIAGCVLAVNGHMHATKDADLIGDTWYFNPGNILRLSIDMMSHEPAVFSWAPGGVAAVTAEPGNVAASPAPVAKASSPSGRGGFAALHDASALGMDDDHDHEQDDEEPVRSVFRLPPGVARHVLPHLPGADVFDQTGRRIGVLRPDLDLVAPEGEGRDGDGAGRVRRSSFVELLAMEAAGAVGRTEDGSGFAEVISEVMKEDEVPSDIHPLIVEIGRQIGVFRPEPKAVEQTPEVEGDVA